MAEHECCRKFTEDWEKTMLSPYATLSSETKGRVLPVRSCDIRTDFQRDRDRIIHCKSFRRLKHKTQVFISPLGDHYRTRLTHTLEVSQIARTLARALRLNEDLTEAIALGHDLGHTPFGHAGEDVLNGLITGGFAHNEQSLRIVEKLENGTGLNLTYEVRDGILNHKRRCNAVTLEGHVVSISDRIAYINHDIDDAMRANILKPEDLPKSSIEILGHTHGERINTLIKDVVNNSFLEPAITMSAPVKEAFEELRNFMFDNVYLDSVAKREEGKAMELIRTLYEYFHANPEKILNDELRKNIDADGLERVTADWIACMTDRFAISTYEEIYIPLGWS